jgi:hypothetical protein
MMSIGSIPPIPWRCLIVRDFRRNFNRLPRRPDVEAEITAMDEHSQGQPIAISLVLPEPIRSAKAILERYLRGGDPMRNFGLKMCGA